MAMKQNTAVPYTVTILTLDYDFRLTYEAYLLTWAKDPVDKASRSGNQNYPLEHQLPWYQQALT